ncbi:MAG: SURF1 family protein [Acidimicrobiia bacterium]
MARATVDPNPMLKDLLRPKWLTATLVVIALASVFVRLGIWQLDRLEGRIAANAVGERRLSAPVVDLADLLAETGKDLETNAYRRVVAVGVFDPQSEVLIRSQVHLGTAGFHVITPLVLEDGTAVLINRGWVPLTLDTVPVSQAPPPDGETTVEGWVELSRERPPLGPTDPETGRLVSMSRVDIERIQDQVEYSLAPVYLVMTGERGVLPAPVSPPTFDDNGPHLGYAIQWFGFAIIGIVGHLFLARRRLRQSR